MISSAGGCVNFQTITEVARETRAAFESGAIYVTDIDLLVQLYDKYRAVRGVHDQDFDTRVFVERAAELFPKGNCGLTSLYIQYRLQAGEVTHGSYDGVGHTIWHIGGIGVARCMADVTSDQFGGRPVRVGNHRTMVTRGSKTDRLRLQSSF